MALKGAVARRYAEAVFDLGKERNDIDRWRVDIQTLNQFLGNHRLAFVLSEPKITFAKKEQILRDLLGNVVQPDALGLALVLTERELVDHMPRIAQEFERLYDDYRNLAKATIITAAPLTSTEQNEIVSALQRRTGKQIELKTEVDPSILGGVVARVGDTLIDGSVKRRLALLREQIISGNLPAETR